MNIGIVFYFLGWVLGIEGILMILPCVVALVYQEPSGFIFLVSLYFVPSAAGFWRIKN